MKKMIFIFLYFLGCMRFSFYMHASGPIDKKATKEPAAGTVGSVLSGGSRSDLFKSWLDKVADFMNQLKGSRGEFIPVIFRPWHELNGNWFWWGGKNSSDS